MRKGRKLAKNEETSWPTERISFFVKITSEKDREEIACGVYAAAMLELEEAAGLGEA
jgi:hypothetical protein